MLKREEYRPVILPWPVATFIIGLLVGAVFGAAVVLTVWSPIHDGNPFAPLSCIGLLAAGFIGAGIAGARKGEST